MAIRVTCVCGHVFKAQAEDVGTRVPCPECGKGVLVKRQKKREQAQSKPLWPWLVGGAVALLLVAVGVVLAIGWANQKPDAGEPKTVLKSGEDKKGSADKGSADQTRQKKKDTPLDTPKKDESSSTKKDDPTSTKKKEPPEQKTPTPGDVREWNPFGKFHCFSSDGRFFLLSVPRSGLTEILFHKTGETKPLFKAEMLSVNPMGAPVGAVGAADITPDGRTFLVGMPNGSAHVYTPEPKRVTVSKLQATNEVVGEFGALAANGKYVILAGNQKNQLSWWDVRTEKALHVFDVREKFYSVALSPDNTRAWCGHDTGVVTVWDLPGRKKFLDLKCAGVTKQIVFTPDGKLAVTRGAKVRVWDAAKGQLLRVLEGATGAECLAVSHDGKHALVASYQVMKLIALADGREVFSTAVPPGACYGLAFSAGSDRVFIAELNPNNGGLRVREFQLPLAPTQPLPPAAVVEPEDA